jgi:hypothetical protein
VPHARGTILSGAIEAVGEIWGEPGFAELRQHLPPSASRVFCDGIVLPMAWYPETYFESFCEVVWRRLARTEDASFFHFVQRSVDTGWTIFHRALMRLATPQRLARRAPDLWRHDHTHGQMLVEIRESSGTVRIRGNPYPRDSIVRQGQAEALRYILSHARVRSVRATRHADTDDDFAVTLDWT